MRALLLVLFILGVLASSNSARAGMSTTVRDVPAAIDTSVVSDETSQQSEDRIKLNRVKRRDVQRHLTKLGFETKASGKFDDATRDAIGRWQEQHGYFRTGFLNTAQHQALMSEKPAAVEASKSDDHNRRRGGGRVRHSRGPGGPIGAIGHMVGGILGR